jgi:hypothetical protein
MGAQNLQVVDITATWSCQIVHTQCTGCLSVSRQACVFASEMQRQIKRQRRV